MFPSSQYRKPRLYNKKLEFLCVLAEDETVRTSQLLASEKSSKFIKPRDYAVNKL